jgi:hypothetical protein
MIDLYCHGRHHAASGLCPSCVELRAYTRQRLKACPFGAGKTTCAKCPVHCYKPQMREEIRAVMRYAGPRMLYRHPIMTLQHMIDRRRKVPVRSPRASATATNPVGTSAACHEECSLEPYEIVARDVS